jgi:hypothetical protein
VGEGEKATFVFHGPKYYARFRKTVFDLMDKYGALVLLTRAVFDCSKYDGGARLRLTAVHDAPTNKPFKCGRQPQWLLPFPPLPHPPPSPHE